MVRALRKLGIDVLRLGSEYRMASDVFEVSLQGRLEHHPQTKAILLEKEICEKCGKSKGGALQRASRIDTKHGKGHFGI